MNARILACCGAVLLSCVSECAVGQIQYDVADLGTLPGGGNSWAYGISENGLVAGSAYSTTAGVNHAFLYSNGTMQDIGTIAGGGDCWGFGVNDSGQVAGYAFSSGGQFSYAFAYSGGTMVQLTPTGVGSYAYGINNSGQVVGVNSDTFLYNCNTKAMQVLGNPPGGAGSAGLGINEGGQVVGSYVTSSGATHPFLYSAGGWTDLGTVPFAPGAIADAISDSGQVAGYTSYNSGRHVFLCSGGTMQDLGAPPAPFNVELRPMSINDSGKVVGWSESNTGDLRAFISNNGTLADLNTMISPSSGWTLEMATGINNSGEICGYGINTNGDTHALLLTPVPEPCTVGLLGSTALALAVTQWLRPRNSCK
jgi:probable HAF family extracellular repeat protein